MFDDAARFSPRLQAVRGGLLHPEWGIVRCVHEAYDGSFGLYVAHAALASPGYFRENVPCRAATASSGTGAGFSAESAHWSAIGEAVERYCASIYHRSDLVVDRATASSNMLDLSLLIRSGGEGVYRFDRCLERHWVRGVRLHDGTPCLVPAQMAFLGYEPEWPHEVICQNDSTGLACGADWTSACSKAFCELLERDVFASNWLLARHPPELVLAEPQLRQLSPRLARALVTRPGRKIRLFHLATHFGVHVIMSCLHTAEGTGLIAAAGAPSLQRAVEKAVIEVLQGCSAASRLISQPRPRSALDIRSTSDHALYYLDPNRFEHVAELCRGGGVVTAAEIDDGTQKTAELNGMVEMAAAEGFQPVAVDLTTSDVAAFGLRVVRMIMPGLQQLIFGSACTDVPDLRRIEQWRAIWRLPESPLNPHPHPFP